MFPLTVNFVFQPHSKAIRNFRKRFFSKDWHKRTPSDSCQARKQKMTEEESFEFYRSLQMAFEAHGKTYLGNTRSDAENVRRVVSTINQLRS